MTTIALALITSLVALLGALLYALTRAQARCNRLRAECVALQTRDEKRLRFFTNLIHELRTPLALIAGPLELLTRAQTLEPRARALTLMARANYRRLSALTEDLLDLARIDLGSKPLTLRPLALDEQLATLSAALALHPQLRQAVLSTQLEAADAYICADEQVLERVVLNLFSNAVKFSDGRGKITIGTRAHEGGVTLFVSDEGIGIAPADRAVIFARFHQIDASVTRRYGGAGIGLALVDEWVRAMGATISVESALGQGACFSVHFARVPAPTDAPSLRMRPSFALDPEAQVVFDRILHEPGLAQLPTHARTVESAAPARPWRLLLVEDEAQLRALLVDQLQDQFALISVADGASALLAMDQEAPDLLITDYMLPSEDGLAVVRAARARWSSAALKIIMITARMDDDQRAEALRSGVDDFLPKPFTFAELDARVANLVQTLSLQRSLRARHDELAHTNAALAATRAALVQDEKLKSIGMLSAGLIHEINNPVNYMRTATTLLARSDAVVADPKLTELVATLDDGLQRVGLIIGDLRVFAYRGPEEASSEHAFKRFELAQACARALRLCAHELNGVTSLLPSTHARAAGLESQVVQVLVNLLMNSAAALRADGATAAAGAQISISVAVDQPKPGRVQITVSDNGPGVARAVVPQLFEPFFTTKELGQGLGLGLATSAAIVRLHGGTLRLLETEVGAAFAFDIALSDG